MLLTAVRVLAAVRPLAMQIPGPVDVCGGDDLGDLSSLAVGFEGGRWGWKLA